MKYTFFGFLNLFLAFAQIILALGLMFFVVPQLSGTYDTLHMISDPKYLYLQFLAIILFGIVNIYLGSRLFTVHRQRFFPYSIIFVILTLILTTALSNAIVAGITSPK